MNSSLSSSGCLAWMIWIIASIFYAYQYILRVMPNIMLDDIMQQFHINAAIFGQFSGVYYIGYSLMHLPIGIMLDRYGPRQVLTICILLTVVGLLPLILTDYWVYPIVGRFLIGIGSSAAILGIFKIIRLTFSEERFPRMLSISVTIGLIGAIYGGAPVNYMQEVFGFHRVIQFFILGGILLACATYWIIPTMKSSKQSTVSSHIKEVFSNSHVIWACMSAGFMVGPLEGFADVWGTAFLKHVYGLNEDLAASLPSMIFIGMCFGAPLLNLVAEKIGYLIAIIISGSVMTVSFFALLMWQLTPELISFSFILVGVCCAYQILAIYKASTYVKEHVIGLTTAAANMIIMMFGYAFHTMIGVIVNSMGGPNSAQALRDGVAVIPVMLSIGTIGFYLILIREKNKDKSNPPLYVQS